jgi:hypothetical protein
MSHSYHHEESDTRFNYNSDMSGDVTIGTGTGDTHQCITLRGDALIAFIAQWVRFRRVCEAEKMTDREALGVRP